ncbi:MAG TPA: hypothetical protein VJ253_10770 [Dehalococcoidia bacterium]|nr:hypothetical protein [Dehalococcoidia bacterium]
MATTMNCAACGANLTPNEQAVKMAYCQADLERAFRFVQDPADWKAPIDCYVRFPSADALTLIEAAVQHFTATPAEVEPVGEGVYRVRAAGYRAGPAGDR